MTAPRPIAALRHRLRLDRSSLAADGSTVWITIATVFAAIEPLGAAEAEAGGGLTGRVSHRIETRWRADVTSRDRLVAGTRIFRIVAVHDLDERRRRLVIHAEEEAR